MTNVLTLILIFQAGAGEFQSGPVRFAVEGPLSEHSVLQAMTPDATPLGYAQRDGDEYVMFAPALKATQKLEVRLSAAEDYPVRVLLNQSDHKIDVTIDKKPFTTYYYSRDLKKPFFFPVLLDGKYPLTRSYPMVELPNEPHDHHHHTSWWVAYGEVNESNYWHESDDDASQQRTVEILEVISGPVFGKLRALNSWNGADGERDVTEEREYLFYAGDGSDVVTDMKVTFTADNGDVVFHDTKEGGVCSFRMNPAIDEKNGNGKMTNSEGQSTAAECWGKPAKWNDYSGTLEGQNLGIAVMDHPNNLRHPTAWHIREYGLYTANCFGLASFTDGKENGDYTIKNGDSLTFNYRVLMHHGNTEEAEIEKHYKAYVDAPVVSVK
jgi:hypothetical protein